VKTWETAQWKDVLTIKNGKSQKNVIDPSGKFPIYGSGGVMGYANDYLCEENTTIIGRKGSINKPIYVTEKFWNVDTAFGLCTGDKLDPKFFFYFCTTYNFLKHNKATTLPSLTKADLLKIKLPFPPLPEQQKIAAILDAADKLRQKDQQLIANYNALSQSLFLDMFGDPTNNSKKWDILSLGDLCEFENGDRSSNYPSKSEVLESGKLFLSSADIGNGYFKVKSSKFISQVKFDSLKKGRCRRGDVLMTLRGNGLGRTCVFECEYDEGFINAQMVILRPDELKCTPRFLVSQLNNTRVFNDLLRYSSGSAQPQFSAGEIKRFKVLVPPLDLQNQFAERIQAIEAQKQQAQASLQKSEDLFNSLLQRAFNAELNG